MSDDDISVGFRPLHALLVGERIVQFEIESIRKAMAEIVIMLVFL